MGGYFFLPVLLINEEDFLFPGGAACATQSAWSGWMRPENDFQEQKWRLPRISLSSSIKRESWKEYDSVLQQSEELFHGDPGLPMYRPESTRSQLVVQRNNSLPAVLAPDFHVTSFLAHLHESGATQRHDGLRTGHDRKARAQACCTSMSTGAMIGPVSGRSAAGVSSK